MKMRLAWYAGVSTGLAASVILSAFHQRANFYSAMVYLAQSSLSLMILINIVFLVYGFIMYGLQRLCYGSLRPVEVEQLYEKAWFAVTETCLAMTIFREEIGAFFLVMFTALVTGKVWGWIGEGRVEILEQQPPANPRLFHTRLTVSLLLSVVYDTLLLRYAFRTVVEQARPTMMVMFLFEFAVLDICSFQTALRYIVSLVEQRVVSTQTTQRLEDRRRQAREARAEILRQRELDDDSSPLNEAELPNPDDVDEMDIEVPGWEAKGQWILTLDLLADFLKLIIYTSFFCVLFTFYGLPIHIMRDWFMTTRSFLKRLGALIRYRQALKDMDQYPDATPEELGQEDTCIICREEMRAWNPEQGHVERTRPKKLPCGHVLHFGCLKSWLERQQVCPTCRAPVVRGRQQAGRDGDAMVFRFGLNLPAGQAQPGPAAPANNGQAPAGQGPQGAGQNNQDDQNDQGNQQNRRNGVRMFNLGPLRLGFAQGGAQNVQEMAQRLGMPPDAVNNIVNAAAPAAPADMQPDGDELPSIDQIRTDLIETAHRVRQEMESLRVTAHELNVMNRLVYELVRLQELQNSAAPGLEAPEQQQPQQPPPPQQPQQPRSRSRPPTDGQPAPQQQTYYANFPPQYAPPSAQQPHWAPSVNTAPMQAVNLATHAAPGLSRYGSNGNGTVIPAGSADLPEGLVIPPGWSLLPLQRLEGTGPSMQPVEPPVGGQRPLTPFEEMVQMAAPELTPYIPRNNHGNEAVVTGPQPPGGGAIAGEHIPPTGVSGDNAHTPNAATNAPDAVQQEDAAVLPTQAPPQRAVEHPPVNAPTPVVPNWGGAAQLFGGYNGPFEFPSNHQQRDTSSSTPPQGEAVEASQIDQLAGSSSEPNRPSGEAPGSAPETDDSQADGPRRNARAVTVEEAEDDE